MSSSARRRCRNPSGVSPPATEAGRLSSAGANVYRSNEQVPVVVRRAVAGDDQGAEVGLRLLVELFLTEVVEEQQVGNEDATAGVGYKQSEVEE